MLFRSFGFAAACCFLLTGFSDHALPKDVTRDAAIGIAKKIHCEAREAINQVTAGTGQQRPDASRRDALERAFSAASERRASETLDIIFDIGDRLDSAGIQ